MPEVIDTIITILNGWLIANTANRLPLIDKIWNVKSPNVLGNQDYVLMYQTGNNLEYPGINLDFKDEDWLLSMDIRTDSREQLILIDDEIIRLLDAANKSVPGYSWLEPRPRRDLANDTAKPFFRAVRDVMVRKLSIVV